VATPHDSPPPLRDAHRVSTMSDISKVRSSTTALTAKGLRME